MAHIKPQIIKGPKNLSELKAKKRPEISDNISSLINEAFITLNPQQKNNSESQQQDGMKTFCKEWCLNTKDPDKSGSWVYFPWNNSLVHTLPEDLFYKIRTARNKNLINDVEQKKYRNFRALIAGLSVGQSAALTIATTGGCKHLKLADFDSLELTNINRIRASIQDIGKRKCEIVAKQIYELDPFAYLTLFPDGVTDKNINSIVKDVDVIVDEIDNFHIKAKFRVLAKRLKLPVVMAFDTADGVVLDVERYDIDKKQKPFWGNLSDEEFTKLANEEPDPRTTPMLVLKTMGIEAIPKRFQESIRMVGSKLAGVPQLGSTAFFAGVLMSFAIRKIANNENLQGRFYIDIEDLLGLKTGAKTNDAEFVKLFGVKNV